MYQTSQDCIIPVTDVNLDVVLDYDSELFKNFEAKKRPEFIKEYICPKNSQHGWGFVAIGDKPMALGYGIVRNCGSFFRIGPVYAENDEIAVKLMKKLFKVAVLESKISKKHIENSNFLISTLNIYYKII